MINPDKFSRIFWRCNDITVSHLEHKEHLNAYVALNDNARFSFYLTTSDREKLNRVFEGSLSFMYRRLEGYNDETSKHYIQNS